MQTLFNQFIFFAFFQSIFLLGIYTFSDKNRKNMNGYVTFLIFALFIGLLGRVVYISDIFGKNFRLIAFSEFSILLFGTTVYLFTKSSLQRQYFSKKDLIHYIPSVLYMGFIIFYFMIPSDTVIRERSQSGELQIAIALCHGVGLSVNTVYWGFSFWEFSQYRDKIKDEVSYSVQTPFFFNFLVSIGVCLALWIAIYLVSIFGYKMLERQIRHTIWLSIAFIVLFIAFYGLKDPEVFRMPRLQVAKKYAQSKLSSGDLEKLKNQLDQLMEEKKPYLNRKLLKSELAEMLGVSNPEIARLLNESIGMNFFEYINYYRIKEFVKLASSDQANTMTFFGLAQDAGFNSKTTFNKSFKKLMGSTPKEYFTNQAANKSM